MDFSNGFVRWRRGVSIVHEAYYEHLKSKYTTDLEEVTQEIDTWLTKNNIFSHESAQKSLPLMICGNSGSGKSTLIAQWIDLHEKSHKRDNDFLLYHFVKISASDREYYFTLFRLYNKIRVNFYLGSLSNTKACRIDWRRFEDLFFKVARNSRRKKGSNEFC